MNIILVSGNLAKTRTLTLSPPQIALALAALFLTVLLLTLALNYFTLRHAASLHNPYIQSLLKGLQQKEHQEAQSYLRESLNAMAVRLGQMQAQLLRLDSLGERLAKLSGIKPQEFLFDQVPGQGGAAPRLPEQDLSVSELSRQMEELARIMSDRTDKLDVLESVLVQSSLSKKRVPSLPPVAGGWYSSNFGWRIDPFTGKNALHEGVDFPAQPGTPVVAAAGGIVTYSGYHPEYGNMIEIDHGNDLVTRYAHLAKRLVNVGAVVLRGQEIGEVGDTGRSTGAHLHFEVRSNGVALNPARFLKMPG